MNATDSQQTTVEASVNGVHVLAAAPGENRIPNPLKRGQRITLPAGTVATSMNPRKRGPFALKRALTITVYSTSDGHIDLWDDRKRGRGLVCLPTITWPGSGGYWTDVRLTPELCQAIGVPAPGLPTLSDYDRRSLDIEPCYGHGYDDRLTVTSN